MKRNARSRTSNPSDSVDDATPFGQLVDYEMTGLFGSRDVRFTLDQDEPTLLTGANGAGKSTVLRTIDAISTARWSDLLNIPFDSIVLSFESGVHLSVVKRGDSYEVALSGEEPWKLTADVLLQLELASADPSSYQTLSYLIANERLAEYRNLALALKDSPSGERLHQFVERMSKAPKWVNAIPARFPVLFVTDQRLLIEPTIRKGMKASSEAISTRSAAEEAASNVAKEIALAQANYARESQSLDQNFPQRAIKAINRVKKVSEQELREQLSMLEDQRKLLRRVALLPKEKEDEFDDLNFTAAHTRAVIDTYVQDTKKKLAVLEPLRRRLALFSDFVNQHYKPKSITFDPENGFTISAENRPESLAPTRLSSGEQQLLVLAHHVLFRASPGTLVLIDEPELSLHVSWQATLVDDLSAMGRERSLTFLLATHSPSLIAGRHDLRRSLDDAG